MLTGDEEEEEGEEKNLQSGNTDVTLLARARVRSVDLINQPGR